jgi:radical SAM superfamily enzyme YgiQ (UPF0313 family)
MGERRPLGQFDLSSIPLGLGYLAAVLELNGVSSTILDLSLYEMTVQELQKKIADIGPDIVGLTSMTHNYPNAVKVAEVVKMWNPEALVVLGGVHATFMHTEILRTVPDVDVVVRYEGENTMRELVDVVDKGGNLSVVKGITYRIDDRPVSTPSRERIEDLDDLPYPAYHLLDPPVEEYIQTYGVRNFPVLTTRGCPFECVFCSTAALHGRKYRTRSISRVVDELEYVIDKYEVTSVSFVDDNFTMQKDRVFELCREMHTRNLSLNWGCSTRVDLVSEELLRTMKEAGCHDIFFGIESASQRVLNVIQKSFSVQQAKDVVKLAEKIGIRTHCSFILGLPSESPESLDSMIAFCEETKPSGRVLPNVLDVLPGTELFAREQEFFSSQPSLAKADITRVQIELLLDFYKTNFGINELFRVIPPNIVVE